MKFTRPLGPWSPRPRCRSILFAVGLALLLGIAVWFMAWSKPMALTHGPLRQEAYIWQRDWSEALTDRLDDLGPVQGVVVLAAEISWPAGEARVVPIDLDDAALIACHRPVGLAVRINAYRGSFRATAPAARLIVNVAAKVVDQARQAGLVISELQLDFDCPTSKLAGYRQWVLAVRQRLNRLPVAVTVLPTWMNSSDFGPLVEAAGRFVLQVHALERPTSIADIPPLCDARRSRRWVGQAARFGVPFRVALPTYAYLLAFDAQGKYLGAASEPARPWPAGTQFRRLSADAREMAELVRQWSATRPALMRGILWYRLPIATDRLNWRWPTLCAIIDGRMPQPDLRVELDTSTDKLVEVKLHNVGDADAPIGVSVALNWSGGQPVAWDALAGFRGDVREFRGDFRGTPQAAAQVLAPGQQRTIAWMRFETNTEVHGHVIEMDR